MTLTRNSEPSCLFKLRQTFRLFDCEDQWSRARSVDRSAPGRAADGTKSRAPRTTRFGIRASSQSAASRCKSPVRRMASCSDGTSQSRLVPPSIDNQITRRVRRPAGRRVRTEAHVRAVVGTALRRAAAAAEPSAARSLPRPDIGRCSTTAPPRAASLPGGSGNRGRHAPRRRAGRATPRHRRRRCAARPRSRRTPAKRLMCRPLDAPPPADPDRRSAPAS